MNNQPFSPHSRLFDRACAAACLVVLLFSLAGFFYVYSLHATDLDGDGWSHVKRARFYFDSLNPGVTQIGTVWLPLFHLLAAPLARNDFLWRTGLAGSLISMASFLVAGVGLFLILRITLERRHLVWLGLSIFLLNPSWLYYQTTPMQEPLSMALLVLTVLFLILWQRRGAKKYLVSAAAMNLLASLNRYEGWFFMACGAVWVVLASLEGEKRRPWRVRFSDAFVYGFIAALAPIYWFAHNWFFYGDALEFIRGPYSARALYFEQIATLHFRYPTEGDWWLSILYYTKSIRYCAGEVPFWVALVGLLIFVARLIFKRSSESGSSTRQLLSWRAAPLLFLVPFVFYVISLAKGRAPTYVADYYPYENFGVRYGHTVIPAVVVLSGACFSLVSTAIRNLVLRWTLTTLFLATLIFPMGLAVKTDLHSVPAHEEPYRNNGDDRRILDELTRYLKPRWHGEMILMNSGYLGRVAQLDAIPLRKVVNEENRSFWELALRYPFPQVQWILAEEGDEVWKMVQTNPTVRRYYREEKVVRGLKAHVIHVFRHHAPTPSCGND
jgi:hypothetical protein